MLALELVAMLAKDVRERPQLWKWIVTGMQNAVQGAMVVALAGTDGCGALRSQIATQKSRMVEKHHQRPTGQSDGGLPHAASPCSERSAYAGTATHGVRR